MTKQYVDMKTFEDVKRNTDVLIEILNHSVTEIKDDIKSLKLDGNETKKSVQEISLNVASIKGTVSNSSKIIWWIMGILAVILGSAILATALGK